jgi:UDP-N-acetylmuramoyl-tripeptide--D-alanyl-D-alanine ligase
LIPLNWYYFTIDLLSVVFIYIMARHMVSRGLFFLQIFQQKGYKRNEYLGWIKHNYSTYVHSTTKTMMNFVVVLMIWQREAITPTAATIVLFILALFWYAFDNRYRRTQSKKPLTFTPRMIRLTTALMLFIVLPPVIGTWITFMPSEFLFDIYFVALIWVFADMLVPYWIFPASLILQPVEDHIQNGFIRSAKEKLSRLGHVKVIAITGSYGKTSTKFILRDILKQRFNVCFTPGSYNTPMGITKVINEDLDASHELLILEMGARYPGNIEELCDIATPDISVITNVGVAHLETFGSVDVIRETKGALVRRVRSNGLAVLNADDENVMRMEVRDDIVYATTGLKSGDIRAEDIRYNENGCTFTVIMPDGSTGQAQTRLLGAHNVANILQGIAVGLHLGMRLPTMLLAVSEMEPIEHRLELKRQGSILVIDDAFNSNPVGAANAVEILSQFQGGRRVIITPGMVELGDLEEKANFDFGVAIGRAHLDRVYLVGPERSRPIHDGILSAGGDPDAIRTVRTLFEANNDLKTWLQPGDIVLYENDLPDTYNE